MEEGSAAKLVHDCYPKVTMTVYCKSKETQAVKTLKEQLDLCAKSHGFQVTLASASLQEPEMEPILCVVDRKSDKILHQVFNFVDAIGGKQSITAESKCG